VALDADERVPVGVWSRNQIAETIGTDHQGGRQVQAPFRPAESVRQVTPPWLAGHRTPTVRAALSSAYEVSCRVRAERSTPPSEEGFTPWGTGSPAPSDSGRTRPLGPASLNHRTGKMSMEKAITNN
jgi:hypothetical protein